MHQKGQGAPQNEAEAAKWYRLAAEQGDAWAQNKLGAMYYAGTGVPQEMMLVWGRSLNPMHPVFHVPATGVKVE